MQRTLLQIFLTVVALCGLSSAALAQSGAIRGVVFDSDGKETLPGANVYLSTNPSAGTATDIDGEFVLTAVPVGTQIVVISYAGFATQEISVDVAEGAPATLNVTMAPAAYLGAEVIVTGQALGQAKAINQQLNSDAIANFVSADKIKELPDVNAAEAISRLPGVAINRSGGEGSKVVVRGLDPKFTAISINGVRLPATSGTDRSVDLSLISPELLSGIELFKSPTPDMDGDALGGSINLNILKAPKAPKASVKALGGYNQLADTYTDYKLTGSYSQRFLNSKVGVSINANTERFNRSGQISSISWGDDLSTPISVELNTFRQQGNALTYARRRESRTRQNGSLGLDFSLGNRTESTLLGIFSRTARDQFEQSERYDVESNRISYDPQITESAITLLSGSISTRHSFDKFAVEWGASYSDIVGQTPYDVAAQFYSGNPPFDPAITTRNSRDRPQNFDQFIQNDPTADYLQRGTITDSRNDESIAGGFADLSVPIKLGSNITATFKTGGKVRISKRTRTYNEYTNLFGLYLTPNSTFYPLGEINATGVTGGTSNYYSILNFTQEGATDFESVEGRNTDLIYSFREPQIRRFQELFGESLLDRNQYQDVNNYALDENVYAGYGMLKLKFGDKFTAIPGVRIEQSDNTYTGLYTDLQGDLGQSGQRDTNVVDRDYTNVLPHLHLKYQLTSWFDIRASYSTTIARPDFNYIVPSTLVNRRSELIITQGNPQLEASVSKNFDLYLTAFKGSWGLFSIGAFQKNIANAFYPLTVGLNDTTLAKQYGFPTTGFTGAALTTFTNSPKSTVKGIEFDLQSNLNFLPKPLNGFVLNLNYSLLASETTINSFTESTLFIGRPPRQIKQVIITPYQRKVPLLGQAAQILNASLGYDWKGLSARVSYSYQGSKIAGYSATADKDRYNGGFYRIDAVLKYKFSPAVNVFVNLNNLSNQRDTNYFRDPAFTTSVSTYGRTATVGAQYNFFK